MTFVLTQRRKEKKQACMTDSAQRNIVSVSWSDHLVFGEGDGRLHTPDAVNRRLYRWRKELGASM